MTTHAGYTQHDFEPSRAAALARVAKVNPQNYAATRNAIEGAVSRLSPYITHGFVDLTQVLREVHQQHTLAVQHKLVYELGWRAYFQHVWEHLGDAIFEDLHSGPLLRNAYITQLPQDIRQAQTGVPAIDMAVKTLYATGYLHNHARMWLASYVVHVRRVHWRAGADWLFGHLLDGDLASNHLSWQWVAGTGSHKPYLFNAENVAKYAPTDWHSPNSSIDTDYDALERMAHGGKLPLCTPSGVATTEPELLQSPPASCNFTDPQAALVSGKQVHLIHPWSLGALWPASADFEQEECICVAVFPAESATAWPLNESRWRFIFDAMAGITPHRWYCTTPDLLRALGGAKSVHGLSNPHLPAAWSTLHLTDAPSLFEKTTRHYDSFSKYWRAMTHRIDTVDALLARCSSEPS